MPSSSYESSSEESEIETRLGKCEVCGANEAKYTCPKCEVKTCCLNCVNIHKKELECDGIRDRTKFVRKEHFDESVLLSDYRMLEECSRFVYAKKRDEKKYFTRIDKDLPIHLYKLKRAANDRGVALQFLLQNFTRHKINTTRYDWKKKNIEWRIEWNFPNAEPNPIKLVDEKCDENVKLSHLVNKYLDPKTLKFDGYNNLIFYHAAGLKNVRLLLKAEKVKGSVNKYFELDPSETLKENLSGKCIIEFPLIFVVLKDHSYNLEILRSDDEINLEGIRKGIDSRVSEQKIIDSEVPLETKNQPEKPQQGNNRTHSTNIKDNRNNLKRGHPRWNNAKHSGPKMLLTEKFELERKAALAKEIKADKKKQPKNLLFTTGYSSEEDMSSSENEDN